MHRDVVEYDGEDLVSLGSSPRCQTQGLFRPGRVLSFQGHPEFNVEVMRQLIISRHYQKIFDDQMFADAMTRLALPHDGILVARSIWKFLLNGK